MRPPVGVTKESSLGTKIHVVFRSVLVKEPTKIDTRRIVEITINGVETRCDLVTFKSLVADVTDMLRTEDGSV
ncbi:MAG: hypothetical protein AAB691_03360 [Patescibacteria group bacterium]